MSDIIDINVAQTVEEVTINVTEEVIQVNINTINGGGGIESVVAGTNITVDNTDPLNPIINANADAVTSVNSDTGSVIVDLQSVLAQGNRTIYEADATYTTQAIDKGRFIFVVNVGVTIFIDGDNYEIGDELEIYNEKPSENLQIVLNSPANFAQGNSDFELEPFCKSIIKKIDTNFWYYNIIRVQNPTTPSLKEVLAVEGRMPFPVVAEYFFESTNKSETIIVDTTDPIDFYLNDDIFAIGDEIEIYNKLSTNSRIGVVGIETTQIYYKDEIIDADMLNMVTLPLYSKSWLKCVAENVFELVIIEQNAPITIDATPTDGSSNAVSSNGVFDALALKQPILIKQGLTELTGVTGVNVLASLLIPANWIASGDGIEIIWTPIKSVTASNVNFSIYHDTTVNGVSNSISTGAALSTVNRSSFYSRTLSLSGTDLRNSTAVNSSLNAPGATSTAVTPTTFDPTVNNYITITANPTVISEVVGFNQFFIRKL